MENHTFNILIAQKKKLEEEVLKLQDQKKELREALANALEENQTFIDELAIFGWLWAERDWKDNA